MSGGEKARLVLAILVYQKPNLLLLDEPTNHLDLDMRHALTLALQNFEGAMVLVSHDRFLLGAVCEDFYLVDNKKVQPFSGDLDDYKQWILSANTQDVDENTPANTNAPSSVEKTDRKTEKRLQAELRKKLQPFKNALKKAETSMAALSADMELVEAQLAESDVYEKENKETLTKLLKQQGDLSSRLQEAEMAWLDAQEALDSLESEAM